MPIEWVEAKVEDHYTGIRLAPQRAEALRDHVRDGLGARRADAELDRRQQQARLAVLDSERTKLLQAHYAGAIPLDLLKSEQDRITTETETGQRRLAATDQAFADIEANLEHALRLAQDCQAAYRLASPQVRRLLNQAFFHKLLIDDEGTVRSDLAEPFALLLETSPPKPRQCSPAHQTPPTPTPERQNPPPLSGTTSPGTIQTCGLVRV